MARRPTALALAVVAATAIAAACSSFGDGDDDGSAPGGNDAGADTSTTDANTAGDVATETGGSTATFFDDFEQGPGGAKWTNKRIGLPATMVLAPSAGFAGTSALVVTFPDNPGPGVYDAWFLQRFTTSTKSLTCSVKLWIDDHSFTATPSLLNVKFLLPGNPPDDTAADFSVNGEGGGLYLTQAGTGTSAPAAVALALGQWLTLVMTISAESGDVDVTVDGSTYAGGKFRQMVRPNEGFEIRLGAFTVGKGDGASLRYDDFACDVAFY